MEKKNNDKIVNGFKRISVTKRRRIKQETHEHYTVSRYIRCEEKKKKLECKA